MWAELPICNRYMAACCVAPGPPPPILQASGILYHCHYRFDYLRGCMPSWACICQPCARNTHACGCPRHHPTALQLGRNAVRSCLIGGVVLLEYCLVLVVVTFNLGLILSATLGFCLGALIFGKLPTGTSRHCSAIMAGFSLKARSLFPWLWLWCGHRHHILLDAAQVTSASVRRF
jgi:hypothetical protein